MLLEHRKHKKRHLPRWFPVLRWGTREMCDHQHGTDAHCHDEAATGDLHTPLDPSAPVPSGGEAGGDGGDGGGMSKSLTSVGAPVEAGATYHFHPATGDVHYGQAAPQVAGGSPAMVRPRPGDHVAIRPAADPTGQSAHARVLAPIPGGMAIRHSDGQIERLTGDQSHRGLQMAPASYHLHELPQPMRAPYLRGMRRGEEELGHSPEAAQWRQRMQGGPQVGTRFREVNAPRGDKHPYGPVREIVHVMPNGRALLANRALPDTHPRHLEVMEPSSYRRAVQANALRPEEPNTDDKSHDHEMYRKIAAALYPDDHPTGSVTPDHLRADQVAQQHFPEQRSPAAIRQIRDFFGGDHGIHDIVNGYATRHGSLESVVRGVDGSNGGVSLHGDILHHTDDGPVHAGSFQRHFSRNPDGDLEVEHELLNLGKEHHAQGFATAFNEQADQLYDKLGVKGIHTHANASVGGYAWAKHGYDFLTGSQRKGNWESFKRWADMNGHTFPRRDYDRLKKNGHAWDMAEYDPAGEQHHVRRNDDLGNEVVNGHFPIGKAYMLQHNWHGYRDLTPGSPSHQQMEKLRAERAKLRADAVQKSLADVRSAVKRPGVRGGTFRVTGKGRLRYAPPRQADPPTPERAPGVPGPPTPRPEAQAGVPHWERFGDWSPEATILHLRHLLLYGDAIPRVVDRYAALMAEHRDDPATSPRECMRRAATVGDGDDRGRMIRALRDFGKLIAWDNHGVRKAGVDPNDWPKPADGDDPTTLGAVSAGLPDDVARILGGIAARSVGHGEYAPVSEDDAHNELAKRLLNASPGELAKSYGGLFLKATMGSVMKPGSRGGHVYWKDGKLHYGNPPLPSVRANQSPTQPDQGQGAAPGPRARRIMRIGHRVLFRDAVEKKRWGKVIAAFGEMLSVLPDDAVEYDLLHTITVPAEKVLEVVPDDLDPRSYARRDDSPNEGAVAVPEGDDDDEPAEVAKSFRERTLARVAAFADEWSAFPPPF